jgi:hypothetical protein
MTLQYTLMPKKIIHISKPLFFAVVLFVFYLLIYPSPRGSDSFAAGTLVLFTALGGSAAIIFTKKKNRFLFYSYFFISIAFPLVLLFFLNFYPTVQLKVILVVQLVGLIWLRVFTDAHLKHESSVKK